MSFSNQWKVIRHYLSMTNLHSEVEKLVSKIKPATPDQWDNLIKRFETLIATRIQNSKEIETKKATKEQSTAESIVKDNIEVPTPQTDKNEEKIQNGLAVGSEAKELTIKGLMQGLKRRKDVHFGKISEPSWKSNKPIVTKSSIHSRTAYVISALVAAETKECLVNRTEHFIDHLKQYPEARDYAIKEGAVRALLRVQKKLKDEVAEVSGIVNEALALMGYVGPTKGPGPNILSIDGGGIRGLIAIEILRHLERLTGKRVHDMFDYVIGVSTGAIITAFIGSGGGSLDMAHEMYQTLSKKMFGNTSIIGGTSRLVWTHSYYDTNAWEAMLQENLRDVTLTQCNRYYTPKLALVSCVTQADSALSPFVFRSYETRFRTRSVFPGTSRAALWQAVRASAAAPTYFQEFHFGGMLHQDGGIMVNNPTGVGLHEVKLLYGANALRNATVISVGTGKALSKHTDYQQLSKGMAKDTVSSSWKEKFNKILHSATDTEGMHLVLNDLLAPGSYYRFNPTLMEECAMDEINEQKLKNLITDTQLYIRRNQHKFEKAACMLNRRRSLAQKVMDYVEYQGLIMGISK